MDIAAMNEKITIQQHTLTTDSIGNHKETWTDYHSCFATVSGEDSTVGAETEAAGQKVDSSKANFTIRYCQLLASLNSTDFRVVFADEIYDILAVDHQNYKKKSLKLMCRKARR